MISKSFKGEIKIYPKFRPETAEWTKYLFFTGKGGVGKTSTACATAVDLADHGKKVFLISTDPASNLQDVFEKELNNKGVPIEEIPNLTVANLNPEEAAAEYRESVVGPYRGKLPETGLFSQKMDFPKLDVLIDELHQKEKKVIFAMGKGGVGKTTVAIEIAKGLAERGKKVHLTTTDPAGHMRKNGLENYDIEISNIDEKEELKKYQDEVIAKSIAGGISEEDLDYIKEDLRSPCTQEIAVFRAFAEIVEKAEERVVVIDTAPTGHTLLLLNSTESYAREMQHSNADIPESVKKLLPRLRNQEETEVVIVTLPEATPYYEAHRLEEDLNRAEISNKWWVINASLKAADTTDPFLRARAEGEMKWIGKIANNTNGNYVVVPWKES